MDLPFYPSGIPTFPSLRTLCLFRAARHVLREERYSILPDSLRSEVTLLSSFEPQDWNRRVIRAGDVWSANLEYPTCCDYRENILVDVVVSGHEWAIEYIARELRDEDNEDPIEEIRSNIISYGTILRYRHLIERYLPTGIPSKGPIIWYVGRARNDISQEMGLTLLAIVEEDVEVLRKMPLRRLDRGSLESLSFFAFGRRSLRSLEYLLTCHHWDKESTNVHAIFVFFLIKNNVNPPNFFTSLFERALREDDVNLFQVMINSVTETTLSLERITLVRRKVPVLAAKYGAKNIFMAYDDYIERSLPSIVRWTSNKEIMREIFQRFPSRVDWLYLLADDGGDSSPAAALLEILPKRP